MLLLSGKNLHTDQILKSTGRLGFYLIKEAQRIFVIKT